MLPEDGSVQPGQDSLRLPLAPGQRVSDLRTGRQGLVTSVVEPDPQGNRRYYVRWRDASASSSLMFEHELRVLGPPV